MTEISLVSIIQIVILISLKWSLTESLSKVPKYCQQGRDEGNVRSQADCEMSQSLGRVTCLTNLPYRDNYATARIVYACSWSEPFISPEQILNNYPAAKKLTITGGNVSDFLTDFPRSSVLSHLTLSNLNIQQIRPTLFALLENLEFLDLSRNRLQHFPSDIIKAQSSLSKIVLSDNPWNCSRDFLWILNKSFNSKLVNKSALKCGNGVFSEKPIFAVMSFLKKMDRDCPRDTCTCIMNNIVWNTEKSHLIPVITVNCSDRGMTELPGKLPVNTTTLLLSRNNISDLLPLIHNKVYGTVADIYLDHNQVKSIDVLEGALWLEKFRVFSLKGNNLTQIPVYALDNAFEKNRNMVKIYLSQNPWKCDCTFTPDFQHLLIKYRTLVRDTNDVMCSEDENDENSNLKIITLSTNSLCRKTDHSINPLDILSVVFGSLIILILVNLLYDWWTFKRTGKLPWLAAHMP